MNSAMIGKTISHYRIVVKPDGGGMGKVHQARERSHPRCFLEARFQGPRANLFFELRSSPLVLVQED
jgi:hypothetical protein